VFGKYGLIYFLVLTLGLPLTAFFKVLGEDVVYKVNPEKKAYAAPELKELGTLNELAKYDFESQRMDTAFSSSFHFYSQYES